jgi:hypothetical protein
VYLETSLFKQGDGKGRIVGLQIIDESLGEIMNFADNIYSHYHFY